MKNIGFACTSAIGIPFLKTLIERFNVKIILTKSEITKNKDSVYEYIQANPNLFEGIRLMYPRKMREVDEITFDGLDAVVVISYGYKIPQRLLNLCPWINIHASLLPAWRGSCPINYALMLGDKVTGLTAIEMVDEIDAGDMLGKVVIPIAEEDNVTTLTNKMTNVGPQWFADLLDQYLQSLIIPEAQNHADATFTKMLTDADQEIDWSRPAEEIYNQIRGLSPIPGARTTIQGIKFKILASEVLHTSIEAIPGSLLDTKQLIIKAGTDAVRLTQVVPSGSKAMSDSAFLRGRKLFATDKQ